MIWSLSTRFPNDCPHPSSSSWGSILDAVFASDVTSSSGQFLDDSDCLHECYGKEFSFQYGRHVRQQYKCS